MRAGLRACCVLEHLELHEVLVILRYQEKGCGKVTDDTWRYIDGGMGDLGGDGNEEREGLGSRVLPGFL